MWRYSNDHFETIVACVYDCSERKEFPWANRKPNYKMIKSKYLAPAFMCFCLCTFNNEMPKDKRNNENYRCRCIYYGNESFKLGSYNIKLLLRLNIQFLFFFFVFGGSDIKIICFSSFVIVDLDLFDQTRPLMLNGKNKQSNETTDTKDD